jgi:hypothetical protein
MPTTPMPTTPMPTTPIPTTPMPTTPMPSDRALIDISYNNMVFKGDGTVKITSYVTGFNIYLGTVSSTSIIITIPYEFRLINGKVSLFTRSPLNLSTPSPTVNWGDFNNLRIETDQDLVTNIQNSVGYLYKRDNKDYYLYQKDDDSLYITDSNLVFPKTYNVKIADNLSEIFSIGVIPTPQNKIKKLSPWVNTINQSITNGVMVEWPGTNGSFLYYGGDTSPGNNGFTFVSYNMNKFTTKPTLVFKIIGKKGDFSQDGGSRENTEGWAYDNNFGFSNKITVNWYAYGVKN